MLKRKNAVILKKGEKVIQEPVASLSTNEYNHKSQPDLMFNKYRGYMLSL